MRWSREPVADFEQRKAHQENRTQLLFLGLPLLIFGVLFLSFMAYFLFAPWEVAYRRHGGEVLRAQVEALPPYGADDHLLQLTVVTQDRLDVTANYSRDEDCAPILAYYRQLAPAQGWTFVQTDYQAGYATDHYAGVFEGYRAELALDCDPNTLEYGLYVSSSRNFASGPVRLSQRKGQEGPRQAARR
jgi:hypothetical protein